MKKLLGFLIFLGFLGASELPVNKVKVAQAFPELTDAITVGRVVEVMEVSFQCFKEHKDLRERGIYLFKELSVGARGGRDNVISNLLLMYMFRDDVFKKCGDYSNSYLKKTAHSVEHDFKLSVDLLSVIVGVTTLPFYND